MPRSKNVPRTLTPADEPYTTSAYEVNTVEDLETHDITDAQLDTALGFTPTVDQFFNDFRVIRVPVLTADAANEAAVTVGITAIARNAGDDGYTVTLSTVADTKFIRLRVVRS